MAEQDLGRTGGRRPEGCPRVAAVGLTGGIGAGKSTALAMFADLGALTISADQVVHDLYAQPGYIEQVAAHFGEDVLDEYGNIDRKRLAQRVKGSREELRWLEKLTHPLVADEIRRLIAEAPGGSVVVCEVPLLFEAGMDGLFDLIVTIEAGRDGRMARSEERFDPVVFAEFESLQASTEQRTARADLAFFNDGSPADLRAFIGEAYERVLGLLEERS